MWQADIYGVHLGLTSEHIFCINSQRQLLASSESAHNHYYIQEKIFSADWRLMADINDAALWEGSGSLCQSAEPEMAVEMRAMRGLETSVHSAPSSCRNRNHKNVKIASFTEPLQNITSVNPNI